MKKITFLTVLLALGLAVLFVMPAKADPPGTIPIPTTQTQVINTTDNPVPVHVTNPTGDPVRVNVGNIEVPAVVTNTEVNPVKVRDTDRVLVPYHETVNVSATDDEGTGSFAAVPVDYQVVIQHVSAYVSMTTGAPPFLTIRIPGSPSGAAHRLLLTYQTSFEARDYYVASMPLQAIVGQSLAASYTVEFPDSVTFFASVSISGYLVDMFPDVP